MEEYDEGDDEEKEVKVCDTAPTSYNFNTTGSIALLNGIGVGDDYNERDGRQIWTTSIKVKGTVGANSAAANYSYNRIMVIYDSQSNGSLPAMTDIFSSSTSLSFLNLNNRERFTILADEEFVLGLCTATGVGDSNVYNVCINIEEVLKTTYNGTGATISNITTGAILLVTIANKATTAVNTLSSRVRFSL